VVINGTQVTDRLQGGSPITSEPLSRRGIVLGSSVRNALPSRSPARCQAAPEKRSRFHAFEEKLRHEKIIALLPLVRRVAVGMRSSDGWRSRRRGDGARARYEPGEMVSHGS